MSKEKIDVDAENILYVSEYGHVVKLVSYLWLFSKYAMKTSEVQEYMENGRLVEKGSKAFYLYKTNKRN
jgi:hypothetical protein